MGPQTNFNDTHEEKGAMYRVKYRYLWYPIDKRVSAIEPWIGNVVLRSVSSFQPKKVMGLAYPTMRWPVFVVKWYPQPFSLCCS